MRIFSRAKTLLQWVEAALRSGAFLLLWLIPTSAGRTQDFTYTNSNGTIIVTGYTGPGGNVTIPGTIDGLPVTAIGYNAFSLLDPRTGQNSISLTSITIPDSVTSVGDTAFYGSPYLSSINLGNGVTHIGNYAFGDCGSLTSINLLSSITSIAGSAFAYCDSLTEITVDSLNPAYSSAAGVLLNKSQTTLIEFPGRKYGSYTIPDSITSIADGAFAGCNLTSITIPHSVTSIGNSAFAYSQVLKSVTIPNSVTNLGGSAFLTCSRLASISIPNSLASIEDYTFASCSLTNITVPASISSLGNEAFAGCTRLTSIYFKGNAPGVFINTFQGDNAATVYYLPGTSGWGTTFGGRPAILWNPQAQITDGGFGVRQNQFGFNIAGTPDIPLVIEATADLATTSWITLQTCRLTNGLLYFNDSQWTNYTSRFYRIRSP